MTATLMQVAVAAHVNDYCVLALPSTLIVHRDGETRHYPVLMMMAFFLSVVIFWSFPCSIAEWTLHHNPSCLVARHYLTSMIWVIPYMACGIPCTGSGTKQTAR